MNRPFSTLKDCCIYLKTNPLGFVVSILSFEFFLLTNRRHPNGGEVILIRAFLSAVLLYLLAIGTYDFTDPLSRFKFSCTALIHDVHERFTWFGAIFAAMYAGFYARFASQWSYLANLYNQIKDAEIRLTASLAEKAPTNRSAKKVLQKLAEWKAGYIEDAENLHLATKSSVAPVIQFWLSEGPVKEAYIRATPGDKTKYESLMKAVTSAANRLGGVSRYDMELP